MPTRDEHARIDLYWIPLGAGGSGFVRLNGRIYEWVQARRERRRPMDLYHTALRVHLPEGRFVVETMWPSPDDEVAARGVVIQGPVWSHLLGAVRTFRYEVRRWREGQLPDADQAVGGPQTVSDNPDQARNLLDAVESIPGLVWGRDQMRAGEMWNSNSVVSWLLTVSRVPMHEVHPPTGGRAPGWDAGILIGRGEHPEQDILANQMGRFG